MYAVIMAGGSGVRLRPLTFTRPKPLVPVANVSALERIASLIAKHGITRAALTTFYLAEQIEAAAAKIKEPALVCFREKKPLGTAGSVRGILPFLLTDDDDSFLIISGDAVCATDITAAVDFHKKRNADVTIVLSHADDPSEYGVVLCDADGKIGRFIEKPGLTQAFANTVNTGIYIMKKDIIASLGEDEVCDFGRDVFPALLAEDRRIYGYRDSGYWCDVGDLNAFYTCNMKTARSEGTLSETGNIFGDNCTVSQNASVKNCVVFDGVHFGEGCCADGALICENVKIGKNAVIKKGCAIGADSVIGDNAVLSAGSVVANGAVVGSGAAVAGSVSFGEVKADIFTDGGIILETASFQTEYTVRIGAAVAAASNGGCVGVMSVHNTISRHVKNALLCGISSAAKAVDLSPDCGGWRSLAAFCAVELGLSSVLFVSARDDRIVINIFDCFGLYPDRAFERKLAAAMASVGTKRAKEELDRIGDVTEVSGIKYIYRSFLKRNAVSLADTDICIVSENEASALLGEALSGIGGRVSQSARLRVKISADGADLEVSDGNTTLDMWHCIAAIEKKEIEEGILAKLSIPYHYPAGLEAIAAGAGVPVSYYTSCPYDDSEYAARKLSAQQLWTRDAAVAAVKVCALLAESKKSLGDIYGDLPVFFSSGGDYSYSGNEIRLPDLGTPAKEGVVIKYTAGNVKVIPCRSGGYKLFADALGMEAAHEIISLTQKKLDRLMKI